MTEQQLAKLKEQLSLKLEELTNLQAEEMEVDPEELSSVDNHPADRATDLMMQTTEMAIDEFRDEEIYDVEQALEAIDNGTYGKCTECGEAIPYERLQAMPTALQCVEHAQ